MICPSGMPSDLFASSSLYALTAPTNTPPRTPLSQNFPKLSYIPPPLQKLEFDTSPQCAYQSPTSPTSSVRPYFQDIFTTSDGLDSSFPDTVANNLLKLNLTAEIYGQSSEPSLFSDLNDDIFSIPKASDDSEVIRKLDLSSGENSLNFSLSKNDFTHPKKRLSPIQTTGSSSTWTPLPSELVPTPVTPLPESRAQRLTQLLDTTNFGLGLTPSATSSYFSSTTSCMSMMLTSSSPTPSSASNLTPNSFGLPTTSNFRMTSLPRYPKDPLPTTTTTTTTTTTNLEPHAVWSYSWPRSNLVTNTTPLATTAAATMPHFPETEPLTPPPFTSTTKFTIDAHASEVYDDPNLGVKKPFLTSTNAVASYPPSAPFYPDPLFALINPRPLPAPPIYFSRRHPALVVELFNAAKHVYVSELPPLVDEGMIRKAFRRFGRIDDIRLSKSKITGQLNGVAYIKFTYADAVTKALNADGLIPVGSKKVRVARSDPMDSPTRKLFFANVWDMTEEDVYPICQQFGTVVQVDVVADRGMMYVHFAKLADAVNAHGSLQGLTINHRYVRVEFGQSNANFGSRLK